LQYNVIMTEQEVYNELKQKVKPYIGIMPQGSYSNYMIRLKAGLLKPATIIRFFGLMGYSFANNKWSKK